MAIKSIKQTKTNISENLTPKTRNNNIIAKKKVVKKPKLMGRELIYYIDRKLTSEIRNDELLIERVKKKLIEKKKRLTELKKKLNN